VKGVGRLHLIVGLAVAASLACAALCAGRLRDEWLEKRVKVIVTGRLIRGAWQRPRPLRNLIHREGIRTILTLTAINSGDPKFVSQASVVREEGVRWLIVPMRGSRGTPEQMALAADLLADPACQPVFFHCVAGHHRTSLVHAAYLIRHESLSAEQAWEVVSNLPWARPDSLVDRNDRFLIEEFARIQRSLLPSRERGVWEISHESVAETGAGRPVGSPVIVGSPGGDPGLVRLESGHPQLRRDSAGPALPLGPDVRRRAAAGGASTRDPNGSQPPGPEPG
jgi:hypothetical protein